MHSDGKKVKIECRQKEDRSHALGERDIAIQMNVLNPVSWTRKLLHKLESFHMDVNYKRSFTSLIENRNFNNMKHLK